MPTTTIHGFFETAARQGGARALRWKRAGAFHELSWSAYARDVRRVARALIALGVQRGESVAIMGPNVPEWLVSDFGALAAGAVPAPIYPTLAADQAAYIAAHCEAQVAIVFDAAQLEKLRSQRARLPRLRCFVLMQGAAQEGATDVLSWDAFLARGDATPAAAVDERLAAIDPRGLATLIYTSGTTGPPKAVMISHDNLTFTVAQALMVATPMPGESGISYLPLSHIAEQMLSLHLPAMCGLPLTLCEKLELLPEMLLEARPALFFGVPRVWEKLQARIESTVAASPPLRRRIFAWARRAGTAAAAARDAGRSPGWQYALASRLVFRKLHARMGLDRVRMCLTGAARLSRATLDFFQSLDVRLYEVYGQSESTGLCTANQIARFGAGTVGAPLAELKLLPDGEILTRGRHVFLGYLKDPGATAQAIDPDGYLHTGDVGALDASGFLRITDRKKDLIITSGGKNVAPQNLELLLAQIKGVAQAVVVGEAQKYLGALFTLDRDAALAEARACGADGTTLKELAADPKFIARIEAGVARINATLSRYETIKKFHILPVEFSIDSGELTPTMKLKRKVVAQRYADEIAGLFAE